MRRLRRTLRVVPESEVLDRSPGPCVFVLSGGGNLGAAQVGMLRAFLAADIVPQAFVACSVGALNATFMAAGPTEDRLDALADIWTNVRREDIFPGGHLKQIANLLRHHDHLHSPGALRDLIQRFAPTGDLSDLAIPTHVVTTNLGTGEASWWSNGPIVDVLTASTAIPGLFPPVTLNGELHVDGGVLHTVPVVGAGNMIPSRVVVLDVSCHGLDQPVPRSSLGVLLRTFTLARRSRFDLDLAGLDPACQITVVRLPTIGRLGLDDFSRSAELMAVGEEAAEKALFAAPTVLSLAEVQA